MKEEYPSPHPQSDLLACRKASRCDGGQPGNTHLVENSPSPDLVDFLLLVLTSDHQLAVPSGSAVIPTGCD